MAVEGIIGNTWIGLHIFFYILWFGITYTEYIYNIVRCLWKTINADMKVTCCENWLWFGNNSEKISKWYQI